MYVADQLDFESRPKIELHVHLEGSIAAETAIELARRHGRDPKEVLPLIEGGYPGRFTDFQQFIDIYLAVSGQIGDPADLRIISEAFAHAQAKQNIIYTETTFTAITHVRGGMDPDEMWAAVREGLDAGGGNVGLIVDTPRTTGWPRRTEPSRWLRGPTHRLPAWGCRVSRGRSPRGSFES